MKYIVDLSDWQEDIDFSKIHEKFDGVIAKISEGTSPQSCYQNFIRKAIEYNMPWGVYCYSHATSEKEAVKEAKTLIDLLHGFPELGIWFDVEAPEILELSNSEITAITSAFICKCNEEGYSAGVYASLSTINDRINTSDLASYVPYWVAAYGYSGNPLSGTSLNDQTYGWQYRDDYPIDDYMVDASEWYV